MGYLKDYNRNKDEILHSFQDLIEKEDDSFSELGFNFLKCGFGDARSQDDHIEFIWKKEKRELSVCFWIPFWKNYKIDENFMVTYSLTNDMDKKHPLISKAIEFNKLLGENIRAKISTLFKHIAEIIN
ncbi:hypothetical protein B4Q04_02170 [Zobellia sp. OII3]|uniref:hypothetical protein n=1 Tax=Zobellia sp. OII3 TaxID=2034520 RepID=UPI000B534EC9|nr:hypothetical protein [Zobellia sp. OII3]OWW26514.1 hypothetical protein B4Q04_02170 [Zobellia sp. OII3]